MSVAHEFAERAFEEERVKDGGGGLGSVLFLDISLRSVVVISI